MSENSNALNLEKQFGEFLTLSQEFVRIVTHSQKMEHDHFFRMLYHLVPMMYVAGLALPETENPDDGGLERIVTEEEWESVFNSLRETTGANDELYYFDFEQNEPDLSKGSLAEMLADIYQDMQDFSWLLSKGTASAARNAVYEIRHLFLTHWGPRLIFIQQHLHRRYLLSGIDSTYDFS